MIRLDKYLCDCGVGTRSRVKDAIKKGQVQVNNIVIKKPEYKLEETREQVYFQGKEVLYQNFCYYMLHKPQGVVTATEDKKDKTVMDLILGNDRKQNLFPVGRLDKDTEGLLLITDNGELAHQLLSPKKKVPKTYYVKTSDEITEKMVGELCEGVDIGEKTLTAPAQVEVLSPNSLQLTITEGKFHQVKRMLKAVNNQVIYLKRISMGNLRLDPNLEKGQYRSLTEEEILLLGGNDVKK